MHSHQARGPWKSIASRSCNVDQNQDSTKDRSGRPLQKDDRVLHSAARPQPERMDAGCVIDQTRLVNEILRNRVVGQDSSIEALVCSVSRLLSGLRDPSRPILTALLLGPAGVGKTESAKALAEALLGSGDALTIRVVSGVQRERQEVSDDWKCGGFRIRPCWTEPLVAAMGIVSGVSG